MEAYVRDLEAKVGMLRSVHGALVDAGLRVGEVGHCEADLVRALIKERDEALSKLADLRASAALLVKLRERSHPRRQKTQWASWPWCDKCHSYHHRLNPTCVRRAATATKAGPCPHCGRDVKRGASVVCPHPNVEKVENEKVGSR